MVPALLWQARHAWPYLELTGQVAQESQYTGGRLLFLPLMLVMAGVLGAVLLLVGLYALLRSDSLRPYRFLAPAFILLVIVFIVTSGRPYYPGGMFAVVFAAGAVAVEHFRRRRIRWVAMPLGAIAVAVVITSLPFTPETKIPEPTSEVEAGLRISVYGQFGWPEMTLAVEESIAALPPADHPAAIVTNSYWQAAALDYYGSRLPPVYSPARGYGFFGRPADSATTVLWIADADDPAATDMCTSSRTLRSVHHRIGMPGASTDVDIRLCHARAPWSQLWPDLRRM